MSRFVRLFELEDPPRVPAVKPKALKLVLPAEPLLTEKGLAELSVTDEMKVIGLTIELLGMDRPASPRGEPPSPDVELRLMEMFLPSCAVKVKPLPLFDAVTPVVPVFLLSKVTTSERVELALRLAVMAWPFK